ncbi:MAG: ATP-binding cassette domain-containing protein [Acidimicrobiales bacterium]|jgi:ABC-2 type transport system ATP-binding protein
MSPTIAGAPLLEASGLTVRFGKVAALDDLDLVAPPGEVLAILGPNGAGKTTFIRTVATLISPTSGSLRVRGTDVARNPLAVRRGIGLAGQYAAVEPTMTGRENLVMTARLFGHPKPAANRAASIVIEQLGLEDVADRRCGTYSGGQRRRLDLGASLVGTPRLLLLDEPTTGLDPAGRTEVWGAVRNLVADGTDVLLTTHYLEEANELADRVVVIDRGKTIASGTLGDLKASIGGEVIEVILDQPSRLEDVGRILQQVTASRPRLDHTRRSAMVSSRDGTDQLATVIRRLDQALISVGEIGLRRPTLDEVFLSLTAGRVGTPTTVGADQTGGERQWR